MPLVSIVRNPFFFLRRTASHFGKASASAHARKPVDPIDDYWHGRYFCEPYFVSGRGYDQYRPAYVLGRQAALDAAHAHQDFSLVEPLLESQWSQQRERSLLHWSEVREAAQAAWLQARKPLQAHWSSNALGLPATAVLNAIVTLGRNAQARLAQCTEPMPQGLIGQVLARHLTGCQVLVGDLERAIVDHGGVVLRAREGSSLLQASPSFWGALPSQGAQGAHLLDKAQSCQQKWLNAYDMVQSHPMPEPLQQLLQRQALTLRRHIEAIHWLRNYML